MSIADNLLIGRANNFVEVNKVNYNPESIGDVINNVAVRITIRMLRQVDQQGFSDTSLLRETIKMPVKFFGQTFVAELIMIDYYDRLNKGVSGYKINRPDTPYKFGLNAVFPSVEDLRGWAQRRRVNVFAVRKSMFEKGTKGNRFFDIAMDDILNGQINEQFLREMKQVGTKQIINGLNEVFKSGGAEKN